MSTISFGSENVFNSAVTANVSVVMLDSTHFVAAYKDTGNSSYGTAIVGSISGTTITYGSEVVFNSDTTNLISVAKLDSTHFVVAYSDGSSSGGDAIVGVTSGTTISSFGTASTFKSLIYEYLNVEALDSTHFVVAYKDSGDTGHGAAIIGTTSGTTISSYGSQNVFEAASIEYPAISILDSTHFVVSYADAGNSKYGTAIVGVTSGTTISSYGSANVFESATTSFHSASALDSTHFVTVYRDVGNSSYGTAIVGVVSGTTISSYGSASLFNGSAIAHAQSVAGISGSSFVVSYGDDGNSDYGTSVIGTVSGTTISSYNTKVVFDSTALTNEINISLLDSTHFVTVYKDAGNSNYGTGIIGEISSVAELNLSSTIVMTPLFTTQAQSILSSNIKLTPSIATISTSVKAFTENAILTPIIHFSISKTFSGNIKQTALFLTTAIKELIGNIKLTPVFSTILLILKEFTENIVLTVTQLFTLTKTFSQNIVLTISALLTTMKTFVSNIALTPTFATIITFLKTFAVNIKLFAAFQMIMGGITVGTWNKVSKIATGIWTRKDKID